MSIMAESGHAENDVYLERPAATRVSNKQIEEAKLSAALQFVDFYFLLHCYCPFCLVLIFPITFTTTLDYMHL